MNRVLWVIIAILVAGILFWGGVLAYLRHTHTTFLPRCPEHGTAFVIEPQAAEPGGTAPDWPKLKELLRQRFLRFGTRIYWEPVSATRVRIAAPIVNPRDAEAARRSIFRGGLLEFRLVHEDSEALIRDNLAAPGYEVLERQETMRNGGERVERLVVKKRAEAGLSGRMVKQAMVVRGNLGEPEIHFTLQEEAAAAFAKVTRENVKRRLAIVIDGKLFSAPVIQTPIETGSGQITGQFTDKDAFEIATILEAPLPIPVTVVEMKSF
jgi:preprotein translocase subunit SecD